MKHESCFCRLLILDIFCAVDFKPVTKHILTDMNPSHLGVGHRGILKRTKKMFVNKKY